MLFNINEKLKESGNSMLWLSEVTNISYPNILKICKGENKSIKVETIDKICTALDCHVQDILKDEKHDETIRRMYIKQNPSLNDLQNAIYSLSEEEFKLLEQVIKEKKNQ
ncbi:helix-turn-helix transcriptional regulator [Clostridium perfringens]|nr:helix-turn-helix transcriptional regulator [Clostridium perfringens]